MTWMKESHGYCQLVEECWKAMLKKRSPPVFQFEFNGQIELVSIRYIQDLIGEYIASFEERNSLFTSSDIVEMYYRRFLGIDKTNFDFEIFASEIRSITKGKSGHVGCFSKVELKSSTGDKVFINNNEVGSLIEWKPIESNMDQLVIPIVVWDKYTISCAFALAFFYLKNYKDLENSEYISFKSNGIKNESKWLALLDIYQNESGILDLPTESRTLIENFCKERHPEIKTGTYYKHILNLKHCHNRKKDDILWVKNYLKRKHPDTEILKLVEEELQEKRKVQDSSG